MIKTLIVKSNFFLSSDFVKKYDAHEVFIEKIMEIKLLNVKIPSNYRKIIITSPYAMSETLAKLSIDTEFFVVGKRAERALQEAGFTKITRYKNIGKLEKNIDKNWDYLYLRGNIVKKVPNIEKILEITCYEAIYNDDLSFDAKILIKSGFLERVFLFSAMIAEKFIEMIIASGLKGYMESTVFYIMSEDSIELCVKNGLKYEIIDYDY
ncbi:uroporphyrinogen-III synthase [Candidatus Deianiraea vastatrix]|uniref:Uroporphyrinogen-III synthase n=1 Tax=Candidatus Deianiraea vastatrix TaxID=2163644 RepID=A0A5B8XFY9_9RICK|nr:uroporphyrinogen-III synthase [Candidatus Deianiraea vastatrix]QED23829.1 Uroporphyrinogen-III synthase [Candidatus Deianiraea vastatrix]